MSTFFRHFLAILLLIVSICVLMGLLLQHNKMNKLVFSEGDEKVGLLFSFPGLDIDVASNLKEDNECILNKQVKVNDQQEIKLIQAFCLGYKNEDYYNLSKENFHKSCRTCHKQRSLKIEFLYHLYSNPIDHIAIRFLYHRLNSSTNYAEQQYGNTIEGFQAFCHQRDSLFYESDVLKWSDEDLSASKDVPCRSEFYKYVQWHNLVNLYKEETNLPITALYHNMSLHRIQSMFGISNQALSHEFLSSELFRYYYTEKELGNVWRFIKHLASEETFAHLTHAFKVYKESKEKALDNAEAQKYNCQFQSISSLPNAAQLKMDVDGINFTSIETLVMFWGFGASGHSWIGAVLDSSPNALIANEFDVLKYYKNQKAKREDFKHNLFYNLAQNSIVCGSYGRVQLRNYTIPGLWQGKIGENYHLKVIGDKKGGSTVMQFMKARKNPWENKETAKILKQAYNKFMEKVPVNFYRMIIVLRHPLDMIATILLKRKFLAIDNQHRLTLTKSVMEKVFLRFREVFWLSQNVGSPDHWYIMKQEDFSHNTRSELQKLCKFTNIDCPRNMINKAVEYTYRSPHKTRSDVTWIMEDVLTVNQFIKEYLSDYYEPIDNTGHDLIILDQD